MFPGILGCARFIPTGLGLLEEPRKLEELVFQVDLGPSEEVVWRRKKPQEGEMTTDELTAYLLDEFFNRIERRIAPRNR